LPLLARFAKETEDYEATKLEIGKYQKNPKFWGFTFASVESGKFFMGRNSVFFVCVGAVDQGKVGFLRFR
jgi:hypothetical protein